MPTDTTTTPTATTKLNYSASYMKPFLHVLGNTLFVAVIDFTVWFAITFYIYLQTKSVFATGIISGIYLVLTVATGFWFGSLVDHNKKKLIMQLASVASLIFYAIGLGLYVSVPGATFTDPANPLLWVFVVLLMCGVIVGNIRTIAMPTLVTILIPERVRDRANGLVGTTTGASFLVTSLISGLLVAWGGMLYVLILAIGIITAALVHLWFVTIPEQGIVHTPDAPANKKIDLVGTWKIIRSVPGLVALIIFTTFNNFLGGVFMALMDAYGLEMMQVQAWGLLWAVLSSALIVGGIMISRTGLGKNPLKTLLLVNVILWATCIIFPLQASIPLLAAGMLVYMFLMPYAEASEQTILQRVVPLERQGRVFGFAQSVEQSASPITAFAISPLAQFVFIPFMTTGLGAAAIGGWFGTGINRGIGLVFIIAGIIGTIVTLLALSSKYYRQLSQKYKASHSNDTADGPGPIEAVQGGLTG